MISVKPSEVLKAAGRSHPYVDPSWWLLYEYFVSRCREWQDSQPMEIGMFQVLNGTSSINNWHPWEMGDGKQLIQRLSVLFGNAGENNSAGDFLRFCKIRRWSDLDRAIEFRCRSPKRFAVRDWFNVEHRKLIKQHNEYHPGAMWACRSAVMLSDHNMRWIYRIYYSYEWDNSSWNVSIYQRRRETLTGFSKRVEAFIVETLGEENYWDKRRRESDIRSRSHFIRSFDHLFYSNIDPDFESSLTAIAMECEGSSLTSHKITLDASKKRTLKRWYAEQAAKNDK